jgi:hypothetical protein
MLATANVSFEHSLFLVICRQESGSGFEHDRIAMTPHRVQLDEFELDLPRYELRRNGRSVKLEHIPNEVVERRSLFDPRVRILLV